MKRYLIAFFVLVSSIAISQDIANHAIPIGGGPTAQGWKTGGPCSAGQTLVWSSVALDPTCTSVSGSGSTPGGANGDIQYNNAGTFGGVPLGTGLANSGTAINCTNATSAAKGCVQTDGATIAVSSGVVSCRTGTAAVLGCVQADGTTITIAAGVISAAPQTALLAYPGGRVALYNNGTGCSGAQSIQVADLTFVDFLCYVPHKGTQVPINGTNRTFSTVSIQMNSSHQSAGSMYDAYLIWNGASVVGCIGETPWTNTKTRSATLTKSGVIYVNTAGITHCWNGSSDLGPISASQALAIGAVYALTNGGTQWVTNPNAATGGTDNVLGFGNLYQLEPTMAVERELTPNWPYSLATWRCVNGSCNNRIRVVDALGLTQQKVWTLMTIDTGDNQVNGGTTNVCIDCSPADTPGAVLQVSNQAGFGQAGSSTNQGQTLPGQGFNRSLGLTTYTFLEIGGGGTATEWFGNTYSGMFLLTEN